MNTIDMSVTRRNKKKKQHTRKKRKREGGASKLNKLIELRNRLVQHTETQRKHMDELIPILRQKMDPALYQAAITRLANTVIHPPNNVTTNALQHFKLTNVTRLAAINELAVIRIQRKIWEHRLEEVNREANNIANYSKMITKHPVQAQYSELSFAIINQNKEAMEQRIAAWKDDELDAESVIPSFRSIDTIYSDIISRNPIANDKIVLNIAMGERSNIYEWIMAGMDLLHGVMEHPDKTPGDVSMLYQVVYFVAKGLSGALKRFSEDAMKSRGGTFRLSDFRECSAVTAMTAHIFYEWRAYQLENKFRMITPLMVKSAKDRAEKIQSEHQKGNGCIGL
jgi:hypothetical protein